MVGSVPCCTVVASSTSSSASGSGSGSGKGGLQGQYKLNPATCSQLLSISCSPCTHQSRHWSLP